MQGQRGEAGLVLNAEPDADAPEAPPRRRGLAGFYAAACAAIALGLLGAWLWSAWRVWWFDAAEARRRQAGAARRLGLPVERSIDLGDGVIMKLVLVPAGWFDMGSPDGEAGRKSEEEPLHRVRISRPFYMGRHEVTQEVWERVTGGNPSCFKGPKLPVESVSWNDCQDFLNKLNALVKERGTFRLPTEAEWEWACRAGTRTRFCFGEDEARLGEYAWYDASSGGRTHPVGQKRPNAWGLYDCHGNVWEWCSDWRGPYAPRCRPFSSVTDPAGPAAGAFRVLRGGSWYRTPSACRSAFRGIAYPAQSADHFGLRVLLAVPPREP